MKAVILTGRLVQDQELCYPQHRLQEAGYEVDVAAESVGVFHGIQGVKFKANKAISELKPYEYGILVIPGGVKCMEHLRLNQDAVQFVRDFDQTGLVIASICSGAQMLISAGLVRGKKISAYPAMRVDVENAGGEYSEKVVAHERIVSGPHYDNLGEWMALTLETVKANKPWEVCA